MKLYVLEKTNGAVECVGVVTKDINSLTKIMNFRAVSHNKFETLPDESYEEYNKKQAEKYNIPYKPFIEKYNLIFECQVVDELKEDCVFRVEE